MRLLAVLSTCLLCTGPGRRLHRALTQSVADHVGSSQRGTPVGASDRLDALAVLLLARRSAAAFSPCSTGTHLPKGGLSRHIWPSTARSTVECKSKQQAEEEAARVLQNVEKLKQDIRKKMAKAPIQKDNKGTLESKNLVDELLNDPEEGEGEEEEEEEEEDLFNKEGIMKDIEEAIGELYGSVDTERVRLFLKRLQEGKMLKRKVKVSPTEIVLLKLNSYIESLKPKPWLEPATYRWCKHLKYSWEDVRDELKDALSDEETLIAKGRNVWNHTPEGEDDLGWKLLPLCECSVWDDANSKLFPKTCELLCDCNVPITDAYFAKLEPGSSIKAKPVNCNFELMSHLGLLVPEGPCDQKVGGKTVQFESGEIMFFDPCFASTARNSAKEDLYTLMLRVYHPELTKTERAALHFAFDCLNKGPGLLLSPEALGNYEQRRQEAASRKPWKNVVPAVLDSPSEVEGSSELTALVEPIKVKKESAKEQENANNLEEAIEQI